MLKIRIGAKAPNGEVIIIEHMAIYAYVEDRLWFTPVHTPRIPVDIELDNVMWFDISEVDNEA